MHLKIFEYMQNFVWWTDWRLNAVSSKA